MPGAAGVVVHADPGENRPDDFVGGIVFCRHRLVPNRIVRLPVKAFRIDEQGGDGHFGGILSVGGRNGVTNGFEPAAKM